MPQQFEITNPLDGATGVRLFFALRRNTITGCVVRGLPGRAEVQSTEIGAHGVDVRWRGALHAGTTITVVLEASGEPVAVAQELWRGGEGALVPVSGPLENLVGQQLANAASVHDFGAIVHALFMARSAIVHAHPDWRMRRYGAFFCDLDLHTNRALIPYAGLSVNEARLRTATIKAMERMFGDRLDERRLSSPLQPATPATAAPVEDVRYVSRVLLDLYRTHLSSPGCAIDPEEVWTAFELFANGQLRVELNPTFPWNGEPDGSQVFGFAEFALMAIEMHVDEAEWRMILPSHVAIQQIYASAYRPPARPYDYLAYRSENFPHGTQVGPKRKAELRVHFWDMPLEALALAVRLHLVATFPDQKPPAPFPP